MRLYHTFSDAELGSLLKGGNQLAYVEIFNRYQPLLFLHALKKMHNEEEAKDMVQEIFMDLWVKHTDFNPERNLAAFLFTCVRNKFVNLLQFKEVRTRYVRSFRDFAAESTDRSDEPIREKQMLALIEEEINALPAKMKAIFLMSRREYKSYKQISDELGISEETVRKQIKNALKILRTRLGFIHYLMLLLFWR